MTIIGEPGFERRGSDWEPDQWDAVGEVPVVEPVRRQTRAVKWAVWLTFVLVAVLVITAGWIGWWYLGRVNPEGPPEGTIAFTVLETDTLDSLADRLLDEGLITDASVFTWYVERKGGLEITPGYYQLPVNDHIGNLLATLRTPPGQTYRQVTFPEGFTIEQMAARLAENQPRLTAQGFIDAANSTPALASFQRPAGVTSLEGLLFPDTYQISNADNEAQVVERMAGLMERVAGQEGLDEQAAALGRTPYEILIVASMIEKEAKLDVDRPKIAAVIYNRLFIGMPLQIDATLYYQNDRSTPFPELRQQISAYNTYLNTGLPPTPIANPGRASIRAALNPSPNPPSGDPICQALPDPTQGCIYLFYVLATEEGGHAFSVTLEQQEANIQKARDAGILEP
jgi:UPF0755 protein